VAEVTKPSFIQVGGQKAGFSISDSIASCPPIRINFTNQSNSAISYAWRFGNGNTSTLKDPIQTYTTPGQFKARLIITGNGGCRDTLIRNINIGGPTGTFTYGPLIGCPPLKVDFTSTTQNVKSFIWDFSDGQTEFSIDSNNSHLYLNPGIYRPRIILEDGQDCRLPVTGNQIIRVVGVRSLIKPLERYQFCDTATIAFTDSSLVSSSIRFWRWDFGDGDTSNLQNPVHTFNRPGRYTVSLYVETIDNCSSISTLNEQVVIAPTPILDIGGNLDLCLPATYTFRPTWVNPDTTMLNMKWNFGQGDTSSLLVPPVVTYPGVGVYTTLLTVNNQYNCPDTLIRTVTVTEVADVLFGSLPVRVYCDSAIIAFQENVTARSPINVWTWDFGDGNISNNRNPTHTYSKPGTYRVKLQVNAINGCISSGEFPGTIRVVASPQVVPQRDTSFCLPANIDFAASLVPADTSQVNWLWDLGNGQQQASASASNILFGTPGVFRASVVATNPDGCTDRSFRVVTVNDTPNVKVVQNTPVCLGKSVRLTATGADRYQWDTQPTLSCVNCGSPTARPISTIIYRVTGSTFAGCSKVDTVLVRVISPKILQTFLGDSICLGESFRLFAAGMDFYNWSPAAGLSATNIASPLASPLTSTVYRVIASDSFNCFPDTAFVPVVVFLRPTVNIIQDKIIAPIGTSITITTQSANVTRWRWTPVAGLSCTNCPEPQFTAIRNIVYRVEVDNEGACPATDEVEVEVRCLANEIFVPNTFSPNGDGRNDRFYPQGLGVAGIKHMRVFNRWGELVFEKTNFNSNDPSQGWDGTYKGQILSPDVFVYMIDVLCSNNQIQELKGNITLLR
jgi:gliding motility-associated-like protein